MDIQTSGYNRDTQQTKPAFIEGLELMKQTLEVFGGILTSLKYNKVKMLEVANMNFATAPDVAMQICVKGKISFREAYKVVKTLIKEKYLKKSFSELTSKLVADVTKKVLNKNVFVTQNDLDEVSSAEKCAFSHTSEGGPAPSQVKLMIKDVKKKAFDLKKEIYVKQNINIKAIKKLEESVKKITDSAII